MASRALQTALCGVALGAVALATAFAGPEAPVAPPPPSGAGLPPELVAMDFRERIQPARRGAAVYQEGKWTHWGGSVARQDGKYFRFHGVWPDGQPWWYDGGIVALGPSDRLDGEYPFLADLSPLLRGQPWAKSWVHGPMVYRFGDRYYMYYVGHANPMGPWWEATTNLQVGVATAEDLRGPWTPDEGNPIVSPRTGSFAVVAATNISVFEMADGRYGMVFKGKRSGPLEEKFRIGMATADHPLGPWEYPDEPNFCPEVNDHSMEDIAVWQENGFYWCTVKTFKAFHGVPAHGSCLFYSKTGLPDSWRIHPGHPIAYDTSIQWADAREPARYHHVEFPFVYTEKGVARAIMNGVHKHPHTTAIGTRPGGMNVLRLLAPWPARGQPSTPPPTGAMPGRACDIAYERRGR